MSSDSHDAKLMALDVQMQVLSKTAATKEDVAKATGEIRVEMHKEFTAQTVRIVGWFVAVAGLAVAVIKLVP